MKYTKESLQNTWGVVESKEHAEFIIELAELHGFNSGIYDEKDNFFYIGSGYIGFVQTSELASNRNEKQITIPLPPKATAENTDFSKPPKHFDCVCSKCGGKCCIGNCDEWIKVDNNVQTNSGLGILKLMPDRMGYCVVDIDGVYSRCKVDQLHKPKSKQDILIEELQTKLYNNRAVDNYILSCDIINGKIEGLSYGDSN